MLNCSGLSGLVNIGSTCLTALHRSLHAQQVLPTCANQTKPPCCETQSARGSARGSLLRPAAYLVYTERLGLSLHHLPQAACTALCSAPVYRLAPGVNHVNTRVTETMSGVTHLCRRPPWSDIAASLNIICDKARPALLVLRSFELHAGHRCSPCKAEGNLLLIHLALGSTHRQHMMRVVGRAQPVCLRKRLPLQEYVAKAAWQLQERTDPLI